MTRVAALVVSLLATLPVHAQDGGQITWQKGRIDDDYTGIARTNRSRVVVYFWAGWNPACAKLDRTVFSDDEVVSLAGKVVCYRLDLSDQELYRRARQTFNLAGLPTIRFFSAEGEKIDEIVGGCDTPIMLLKLKGEGRLWKSHPKDVDETRWYDTHRVVLRNGSALDGRLEALTEEFAILMWDVGTKVKISRENLDRIEWITIRRVDDSAKGVSVSRTPPDPTRATATDPPATGPVVTRTPVPAASEDIKERVNTFVAALRTAAVEQKNEVLDQFSKSGTATLIHAASVVDQYEPQTALWIVAAITRAKEKKAAPVIREKLATTRDTEVLTTLINALVTLQDTRSSEMLRPLLRSESVSVRTATVEALGQLGDRNHIRDLCNAAIEPDRTVRMRAAAALNQLAQRTQSQSNVLLILRALGGNAPENQREQIPLILGQLGQKDANATLIQWLRSREAEVRGNCLVALGNLDAKESVGAVLDLLLTERENRVKQLACSTLGTFKDPTSIPKLIDFLGRESDFDCKMAATRALQQITRQKINTPDFDQWRKWWESQSAPEPE